MSQAGQFINSSNIPGIIDTLTGNSGGAVGPDSSNNINVVGSGIIDVVGNPGTNTLTISTSGSFFSWNVVTSSTQELVANNGYIVNYSGTCVLTLPAESTAGDLITITGINTANGWKIAQNAGQTIYISLEATTTGVTGYLESTAIRDSVQLVCVVDDTDWNVYGVVGNITHN